MRVAEVRSDPAEIVVQVGDSLALGEDVRFVAYDSTGQPVRGVVIEPELDSGFAILAGGYIRGLAEGAAELRMSIRAPPAKGTGPPETRTFTAPVKVVGPPLAPDRADHPQARFAVGAGSRRLPPTTRAWSSDSPIQSPNSSPSDPRTTVNVRSA